MKNFQKTFVLAAAFMSLYAGSACWSGQEAVEGSAPWLATAQAAEQEEAWRSDVDEASRDDTMAYNIYIGKSLQACIQDLEKQGWKRVEGEEIPFYTKAKNGYLHAIALHPHPDHKDLVGSYRVRFYVKDRELADEMYMRAEKNFSYNFGRPSIKRGNMNETWMLNDSFAIVVEYNEYDVRIPIVQEFYPYEIVIKREMGDYKKFFEGRK